MNDTELTHIGQFPVEAEGIAFKATQNQCYAWIALTLKRFRDKKLGKRLGAGVPSEDDGVFASPVKSTDWAVQTNA